MTNVYLWKVPRDYPEKMIGVYDEEHSPDRFLFRKGQYLSKNQIITKPIIKFEVARNQIEQYDCLDSTASIPIINKRLADLLRENAAYDIQLFDVRIECADGELEGYKILNVCYTIKGVDHAQSIYTKMKNVDHILSFKRLFYKLGSMGKHRLAREEEYRGLLLVDQKLHNILQNQNLMGIKLVEPDEYYRNIYK